MHEIWVKCPVCGGVCRLLLIRLTKVHSLLVNMHRHRVLRDVGARSITLLAAMRRVRSPYVGSVHGPQPPLPKLKKLLKVKEPRGKPLIQLGSLFYRNEGYAEASEEMIGAAERFGEAILEWLPKLIWLKHVSGAGWRSLTEAYAKLLCSPSAQNR